MPLVAKLPNSQQQAVKLQHTAMVTVYAQYAKPILGHARAVNSLIAYTACNPHCRQSWSINLNTEVRQWHTAAGNSYYDSRKTVFEP